MIAEGRKKEEGRRKKEEGRGKREEGRGKREKSIFFLASSFVFLWCYDRCSGS
ncbi:MAG: hypothetical protein HC942_01520 [Microcoleus sp. SU_5_6]|nr:hypothetical protein [Microcoleus sp. SU_5_6]